MPENEVFVFALDFSEETWLYPQQREESCALTGVCVCARALSKSLTMTFGVNEL